MHFFLTALALLGCVLNPATAALQARPQIVEPAASLPAPSYTISTNNSDGEVFVFTIRPGEALGEFQVETMELPLGQAELLGGLTQADLDARENYVERLVSRLGVRDQPARTAVDWLKTQTQEPGELAWTARLVLREFEQRHPFAYGERDPLGLLLQTSGAAQLSVEGLPNTRPFESDSRQQWVLRNKQGSPPSAIQWSLSQRSADNAEAAPASRPFQLDAVLQRDSFTRFPVADLTAYDDYTFELRCGPNQARLRVLEVPEIQSQTSANQTQAYTSQVREYHGRSLEEILSGHPELESVLPFAVQGANRAPAMQRTDVLGVYVRDVSADKRIATTSQAGEMVMAGMVVARVEPGTIAESMGVAPGSIMIKVCGQPVMNGDSISESLHAARERLEAGQGDGAIEVEWLDPWRRHQTRIWRGTFAR